MERQSSHARGRPSGWTRTLATLAVALIAAGALLLVAAGEPRGARSLVLVGGR